MREEVAGTTALLGPLLEGVLEDRLEGEGAVGVRGWMDSKLLIMNDLFSTYLHQGSRPPVYHYYRKVRLG